MPISNNRKDRVRAAYKENATDGGTDQRTCDLTTHDKLDDVISALGGASNTTPAIFNVSAPLAATEYSQALPANCKGFIIKARGKSKLQLSYTNGASGTVFVTIPAGAVFEDKNFYTSQTLYFQVSKISETVEITAYS